jgi:hypothetical protein
VFLVYIFGVLEMEPWAFCTLGGCSTMELRPKPPKTCVTPASQTVTATWELF